MGGIKDFFSPSQQSSQQSSGSSTQAPWDPQIPYLTYGFGQAKDIYQNAAQNPVYQGQRVADLNGYQTSSADNAGDLSNNSFGYANNLFSQGNNLLNTGSGFGGNAQSLYQQAMSNPNGALNMGNAYANSDVANGLIQSAGRDVTRNLYENQLPTLAKAAAGSGNTNSTRAGVESAIAQRGAADRLADISSNIRGTLFDAGNNQYNTNFNQALNSNNQLSNAYSSGMNGLLNGANLGTNLFNLGQNAGGMYQQQGQNQINADMNKFNEQNNNALDLLSKYMGIVKGNYGGTSNTTGNVTNTASQSPSGAQITGSIFKTLFG